MRLIVTRPPAQAGVWVERLRAWGLDAAALPLIHIGPPDDAAPVHAAWHALPDCALVVFVSPNAVQQFFALRPAGCNWPAGTRGGSTGPGTSAALRSAGLPQELLVEPASDAAVFDSEALWARLQDENWAGRRVLVVRGEDGRDWLAGTLRERGAAVDFVAAYRRLAPVPDTDGLALLAAAVQRPRQHLWIFSSSEAIGRLRELAPAADWSAARALATHPRIAEAACAAGFGDVRQSAPEAAAVARAAGSWPIESAAP